MGRNYNSKFKCNYLRNKKKSEFFAPYLKSTSNFEHFGKKDDRHRSCIFRVRDYERRG